MEKKKSCLKPGTKVELAIISKSITSIVTTADDAALLQGCVMQLVPDVDLAGNIKGDILTKEEASELEELLSLGKGGLNPHQKVDNYWKTNSNAFIELKRTGKKLESATIELDLGDPYDYIKYKICLNHRLVSNKWSERKSNPDFKLSLRSSVDEQNELNAKVDVSKAVKQYLFANAESKTKLFNLIRLFNSKSSKGLKKLSHNQSAKWLFNQLWEFSENPKDEAILYEFVTMKDEIREAKVFILNGVTCGALTLRGSIYSANSGELLGHSEQEAIEYLNSPANQNVKLKIQTNVEKYLKSIKSK